MSSTKDNLEQEIGQTHSDSEILQRSIELDLADPEVRELVREIVESSSTTEIRTHLLPPELIRAYEDLIPGFARDSHEIYLEQRRHNNSIESWAVKAPLISRIVGQVFGLVFALSFGWMAVHLGLNGQPILAGVFVGATLTSIVATFVVGKKKSELE